MPEPVHGHQIDRRASFRWTLRLSAMALVAIGLFFLLTEHRAHSLGALPYLLLLLCPALHLFMHRGHGHGQRAHAEQRVTSDRTGEHT